MMEEEQLINHWLNSKDYSFLIKEGIDKNYFLTTNNVIEWVENFYKESGVLPSIDTVSTQFDNISKWENLEPVEYLIKVVKENKIFIEFRPLIIKTAEMLNEGNTYEALYKIRNDVNDLLKKYSLKCSKYDWVKDAEKRFSEYMKRHNQEGLSGLTTGIDTLDKLTGGWCEDDLILLSGRTNEGKSFLGLYFIYSVWQSLLKTELNNPVVYITTEMSAIELSFRLDSFKAHFSNQLLTRGKIQDPTIYEEYLRDLSKSKNSFLILDQESNGGRLFTPDDIRKIIETEHPAFIVIDQLYDLDDGTGERDIRKKIVNITRSIRDINLETKTPVLLVAQANRESARESKKNSNLTPELYQIQESDNPAQKSTVVLTLKLINNEIMKISVKKNRHGEKNKDVYMRIDFDNGIWEETATEEMVF
jgi:replicative DNA helicase